MNDLFQNYGRHYHRDSEGYRVSNQDIRKYKLDRLPRWVEHADRRLRVLDAGCADGYLLSLLAGLGFHHLSGIDLSVELADQARSQLGSTAAIHTGDMREYLSTLADASLDVILFHHVIEHVPRDQLIGLLSEMQRVLSPGGRLNIRTPNANCIGAMPHMHNDYTHLFFFNDRGLLQVLEAAGFDAQRVDFTRRPPRLLSPLASPRRAVLRALNFARWHANNGFHRFVYALAGLRPMTGSFDAELEATARK